MAALTRRRAPHAAIFATVVLVVAISAWLVTLPEDPTAKCRCECALRGVEEGHPVHEHGAVPRLDRLTPQQEAEFRRAMALSQACLDDPLGCHH